MDRLDAMKVLVTAVDEGSLAAAGRKLGKSPPAVSRAVAFLENLVGLELLHRTTRSIRLSEAGERYVAACRRVLAEYGEAEAVAAGEQSGPRGLLTVTVPVALGELILMPIVNDFMKAYPAVSVRVHLMDQTTNLVDEGVDLALRVAHLADSTLIATKVGTVRRIIVAAKSYLEGRPPVQTPADLARHQIVAATHFGVNSWSFPPAPGSSVPRTVQFTPKVIVNTIRGSVASTIAGAGIARLLAYHVVDELTDGTLKLLLAADEFEPVPVHLLSPQGRLQAPKVRAFADFSVPRLRAFFAEINQAVTAAEDILPQSERLSTD